MIKLNNHLIKKTTKFFLEMRPGQIIAIGFAMIILAGALLLSMPFSSKSGDFTPFFDSLFTATSATCVTGLVVYDTATQWSVTGQLIILCMIQIGGLGFMTAAALFLTGFKRKISLKKRLVLIESAGTGGLKGAVDITKKAVLITVVCEIAGTALLAVRFVPQFGLKGLYYAVFTSISAFCNAGFDVFGTEFGPGSSLMSYYSDVYVCSVIMMLIVVGGLGFFVIRNLFGRSSKKIGLHTKLVLTVTTVLLLVGTGLFFVFESKGVLDGMSFGEKLLSVAFQSVTARTAGFNTITQNTLTDASKLVTSLLMFVGGSPGSTAGGIKTVTLAVTVLATTAFIAGHRKVNLSYKTISTATITRSFSIFIISLFIVLISSVVFSAADGLSLADSVFMSTSSLGTVGISVVSDIKEEMSVLSRTLIIFLMYAGRIGSLAVITALTSSYGEKKQVVEFPDADIFVG